MLLPDLRFTGLPNLQNKLATELTNEELLKLLEGQSKTEVKRPLKNTYLNFINKYNLQPGQQRVPTKLLYKLYKIDNPKADQKTFTKNMKKYLDFSSGHHDNVIFFLLNKSLLEVGKSIEDMLTKKPTSKKQVRNRRNHIEDFLKAFNLKPGNNSITVAVLIDLYDRWCYKYKRKKVHISELVNLIQIYIPIVNKKYYKVHDDLFKVVSLETIKRISNRSNVKEKK